MKIYILTDIEGTCGVARWEQGDRNHPTYPQAVRLMTEELRACVAGIQSATANPEIWIWDAHGCGSIDFERLPRGCQMINTGAIPAGLYFDRGWDALFFCCQHSKAGTLNGNLAHTYSSSNIEYFKINGVELGEFGCRAALAGSYGIPTVFVSGDDTMMAEAKALIPGIYGAQVKVGLGPQTALHLAPEDARDLIRDTAAKATANYGTVAPLRIPGPPYEQEVSIWGQTDYAMMTGRGFEQVGARRFVKRAERLDDLWI
ncbi:MAG: M55 family metallopeptidase [Anaerolineae bacterium]